MTMPNFLPANYRVGPIGPVQVNPSNPRETPITFANGSNGSASTATQTYGPGATMPYGSRGRPAWQPSLEADEASGQPVEVSPGVWVYPNGQPVTGAQLAALNSASTVLPTSMNAENNTILAEEQPAATATPSTTTTTTTTSYFSQSTLYPPYTNGQVLAVGGGVAALLYLFMKKR